MHSSFRCICETTPLQKYTGTYRTDLLFLEVETVVLTTRDYKAPFISNFVS